MEDKTVHPWTAELWSKLNGYTLILTLHPMC